MMKWLNEIDQQAAFDIGAAHAYCPNLLNEPVVVMDFYKADSCPDTLPTEEREILDALYSVHVQSGTYLCTRLYSRYTDRPCQVSVAAENIWDVTSDGKNHNTFIWLYNKQAMLSWNVRAGVWYIEKVDQ